MNSTSDKIKVYTNGIVDDGIGAYAYIVLESKNCGEVDIGGAKGIAFAPCVLKAKFAQAGKATDDNRMKMRAAYESIRHCPDGREVEVYTDNFLMKNMLEDTPANFEDGDIAERFRRYSREHHITTEYHITKYYNGHDFPCNDHDEWTWYAYWLCENAIKQYKKEHRNAETDKTDTLKRVGLMG